MGAVKTERDEIMGSARDDGNVVTVRLTIFPDELARLKAMCRRRKTGLSAYIAVAALDRLQQDEEAAP